MRIAVGGISQETSSFTPVETELDAFRERFLLHGEAILATFSDTNTPIGGFIEAAREHPDVTLVPTMFAEAHPAGPAPAEVFTELVDELVTRIAAAVPVDAMLLDLHGAMVTQGCDDCEGEILARVRQAIGRDIPLLAQLDIHANVSSRMVEAADILVGRRTYPEVDMAARGRDCLELVLPLVGGSVPRTAFQQLPFVWGVNQATGHHPMRSAIEQLEAVLSHQRVLTASIATGYPYADVPCMGASVWVTTDGDAELAAELAKRLGRWITARRDLWSAELPSTAEALCTAPKMYPLVLADRFDNTGAGTPGDSTGMLRAFLEADLDQACVLYIVDPESAERCHEVGSGRSLTLQLGGKSAPEQGRPVELEVEVIAVSDGSFRYGGTMYAGLDGSMGASACVRHRGVHVVLVSVREQPYDTAFAHTLGLEPERMRYVGVKSQAHFRAGFEDWAGEIRVIRESSVHNPPAGTLRYSRVRPEVDAELERA